jgi:hypothetical protein
LRKKLPISRIERFLKSFVAAVDISSTAGTTASNLVVILGSLDDFTFLELSSLSV